MDLFQTAVSAEFTMLNVLPFRKELLSSKAEELLSVFVCFFFFKYMLTTSLSSGKWSSCILSERSALCLARTSRVNHRPPPLSAGLAAVCPGLGNTPQRSWQWTGTSAAQMLHCWSNGFDRGKSAKKQVNTHLLELKVSGLTTHTCSLSCKPTASPQHHRASHGCAWGPG